jgi:hypothetical protein
MSWSYSGNPSSSDLDAVRFLIGDTDTTDQLLQNEEINYLLAQTGNDVYTSAIIACRTIASKFSRKADQKIGDYSISNSQKASQYLALATQLAQSQAKALISRVAPYAGGISVADKQIDENNTDTVQPAFTRNDMTFPGSTDTEVGE